MAQAEITTGPYRVASLTSREAADQLGPQVGVLAEAVLKSADVAGLPPAPYREELSCRSSA